MVLASNFALGFIFYLFSSYAIYVWEAFAKIKLPFYVFFFFLLARGCSFPFYLHVFIGIFFIIFIKNNVKNEDTATADVQKMNI